MSSRGSKGKSKASSSRSEQPWSQWAWDSSGCRWYRTQLQQNGDYVYDYEYPAADPATPRSEATSGGAPYVSSSSTGSAEDPQYSQNRNYGYSQESSSVETLTDDFSSKAAISTLTSSSTSYASPAPYSGSPSSSKDYRDTSWGSGSSAVATASGRSYPSSSAGYGMPSSSSGSSVGFNQGTESQSIGAGYALSSPSGFYNTSTSYDTQTLPSLAEQGGNGALTPKPPNTISGAVGAKVGEVEPLDPRFKVHSSVAFKIGYVFKVLWSEPQGVTAQSNQTDVTDFTIGTKYGEKVYQSIRRFVIVATGHGHSSCIPIHTYQHKGANKSGISRLDHAFVYTGDLPKRLPQHAVNLQNDPVQVKPNSPRDKLHPDSCINFAKIYNVEHNVKVCFIGRLSSSSEKKALLAVNAAWARNSSSN